MSISIRQDRKTESNINHKNAKAGFTLMEILIVIVMIGGLIAFFYPKIRNMQTQADVKNAHLILGQLRQSIDRYYDDTDEYPKTLEDLVRRPSTEPVGSKWSPGGYLGKKEGEKVAKVPVDPWKRKIVYNPPKSENDSYELYSYGPNGPKGDKKDWIK